MKKINGILIALILIAIHVALFFILVGKSGDELMDKQINNNQNQITSTDNKSNTTQTNLEPIESVQPGAIRSAKENLDDPNLSKIYNPTSEPGKLRSDNPNRLTKKNYDVLIGDPYQGAIVVDAHTGKILIEERANAYSYPASVTKLMTLLVCLEAIDKGEIDLTDRIKINDEIYNIGGSQLYLDPRETNLTVKDMLYGIMVHSANDAARALGLHISGSRSLFVERMNKRAKIIGMTATHYVSDHGLPPDNQTQPDISTAYDIALLALACLRHPETLTYTGTELIYLRDGKTMLATRNTLAKKVDGYAGCDGLKTGYHGRGGWSLVATAERNGRRIISVVLGSPDKDTRNDISRRLLDRGFEKIEANR